MKRWTAASAFRCTPWSKVTLVSRYDTTLHHPHGAGPGSGLSRGGSRGCRPTKFRPEREFDAAELARACRPGSITSSARLKTPASDLHPVHPRRAKQLLDRQFRFRFVLDGRPTLNLGYFYYCADDYQPQLDGVPSGRFGGTQRHRDAHPAHQKESAVEPKSPTPITSIPRPEEIPITTPISFIQPQYRFKRANGLARTDEERFLDRRRETVQCGSDRRDSVFDCRSPLPLFLFAGRLKTAQGCRSSKIWRRLKSFAKSMTPDKHLCQLLLNENRRCFAEYGQSVVRGIGSHRRCGMAFGHPQQSALPAVGSWRCVLVAATGCHRDDVEVYRIAKEQDQSSQPNRSGAADGFPNPGFAARTPDISSIPGAGRRPPPARRN